MCPDNLVSKYDIILLLMNNPCRHWSDRERKDLVMKKFFEEFKKFIARGNVMDMAVGVIIGSAFTAIVTSLVDDLLMPVLSLITGGMDFSSLCIVLGTGENAATLNYGSFIAAIINFLLIAIVIFILIKAINKATGKKEAAPTTKECPYCHEKISLKATRCPHCTSELDK